jgi:hypothetical protein
MPYETDGEDYSSGDDSVLGALMRPKSGAGKRRILSRPPLPQSPAQPYDATLRSYVGFGIATWAVADAADKTLPIEPQESFRGERLIIDVAIAAGVTNAPIVLLRRIDVGTMPQSPSVAQAAPAAMFARDAVGSKLDLQIAYRGTNFQLVLGITAAPAGAGQITAACGMYGEWIR